MSDLSIRKISSGRTVELCKGEAMEALKHRINYAIQNVEKKLDELRTLYQSPIHIQQLSPTYNSLETLNMLTQRLKACDLGTFLIMSELTDYLIGRLPDHLNNPNQPE